MFNIFYNLAESLIDNIIMDNVQPVIGSVVYCELAFGSAEHSGIYVGRGGIVHLDGSGDVELVTPSVFLNRLNGFNSAISIYVSCRDGSPVGRFDAAERAKNMVGENKDYNLLMDNCHQFSSGCVTGKFGNSDSFLWMLKSTAEDKIGANSWRVWRTVNGEYL